MLKNTQANKPSGTKEGFGHARFASKTRRGFKQGLPDLGTEAIIFLKLTPMQEQSETQLHTVRVAGTSEQKRWVSLGLYLMWRVWRKYRFSVIFTVLVASVLPNLRCSEAVFLKLTLIVVSNRTRSSLKIDYTTKNLFRPIGTAGNFHKAQFAFALHYV